MNGSCSSALVSYSSSMLLQHCQQGDPTDMVTLSENTLERIQQKNPQGRSLALVIN